MLLRCANKHQVTEHLNGGQHWAGMGENFLIGQSKDKFADYCGHAV
jgi:hypothetical protein